MVTVSTNAGDVAARYRDRVQAIEPAVRRGVRNAALAVERAMVMRLNGGGKPWTYPVPVRTGNLKRSTFVRQPASTVAVVGDTAVYAHAIHEGVIPVRAKGGGYRMAIHARRPFLDDAVTDAQPGAIVTEAIVGALGAIGGTA